MWNCWGELLSYLEQENKFLDQLEQKLDETDSLQGGAEELQEALDVRPSCFSLTSKGRSFSLLTSPSFNCVFSAAAAQQENDTLSRAELQDQPAVRLSQL